MFGRFRDCGCRSEVGTFRLIATSASTAALEGEADMAGNGPKTTFMTHSSHQGECGASALPGLALFELNGDLFEWNAGDRRRPSLASGDWHCQRQGACRNDFSRA